MNTIELIQTIARRPGMYVDPASVDSIYGFIQGFHFARSLHGGLDTQDHWFAEQFHPWLQHRHNLAPMATWRDQVARLAEMRQAAPWSTFIEEFDRFLREGGEPAARV